MSKYQQRGAYHYEEFGKPTTYRLHVLDLVDRIMDHVPKELLLPKVAEIGCGEGLILSQLSRQGFLCEGCDVDLMAVELGKKHGNRVQLGTIDVFKGREFHVVLLCDVLEHVENPALVMADARALAPFGLVVIAVPDRKDRHAIHEVDPRAVKSYMEPNGFECVHQSQRHARHLMIFQGRS